MRIFRLCSRKYEADNSDGAPIYGGRWNEVGTPEIYTSESRSLAALEVIVHNGAVPWDYQIVEIEVPDDIKIETIALGRLPKHWFDHHNYKMTAALGTAWAKSGRTAVLKVPSAAIRSEHNYVLNP